MANQRDITARVRVQDRTKGGLNQAKRNVSRFAREVKGITAGVVGADLISSAGRMALQRVEAFFRAGIDFTKAMETANAQFKVLLGTGGLAEGQVNFIRQFAADTPFFIQQVTAASRLLVQFIGNTQEANKYLSLVGDAAAGAGADIENVALWWGRFVDAARAGRPVGEATARLQELGLITGHARSEIEELIEAGKGLEAIQTGENALRRTEGAMGELRETLAGAIDTATNATQEFASVALEVNGINEALKDGANAWTDWMNAMAAAAEEAAKREKDWQNITAEGETDIESIARGYNERGARLRRDRIAARQAASGIYGPGLSFPTIGGRWNIVGGAIPGADRVPPPVLDPDEIEAPDLIPRTSILRPRPWRIRPPRVGTQTPFGITRFDMGLPHADDFPDMLDNLTTGQEEIGDTAHSDAELALGVARDMLSGINAINAGINRGGPGGALGVVGGILGILAGIPTLGAGTAAWLGFASAVGVGASGALPAGGRGGGERRMRDYRQSRQGSGAGSGVTVVEVSADGLMGDLGRSVASGR